MTVDEVMARLQAMGDEKTRAIYAKDHESHRHFGVRMGANHFGVKMGDLRVLAKEIKPNPELAAALWKTGNADAMLLATLLMKPKKIPADELDRMVRSVDFNQLADWLTSYVVKQHPEKESLRQRWMSSDEPYAARAGWSLTAERIEKNSDGLDIPSLLDRIEKEMPTAPIASQWTMNYALANIGIHHPEHRERALAIGEKHGVYRDYPVSKGCTSPFAPIWINEMVSRQV